MRLMPALAEEDCAAFAAALGEMQRAVGDYFAPAQGGRFASAAIAAALAWLEAKGVAGVGQTSWGPTGFAVVESQVRGHALVMEARERFHSAGLELTMVSGRNHGHVVRELAAPDAVRTGRASERAK
jgi:beta-ribofuranosylaminobenzene 5'-phosphate synthase